MNDLFATLGRFHPVVLHVPIGLLVGVVVLEIAARRHPDRFAPARTMLAWLLVLAAAFAIGTGLLLQQEPGYGGETLTLHLWTGVGFGVGTLLFAAWCSLGGHARPNAAGLARALLLLPVLGLGIAAGHLGGTLTHGENFLTAHLSPAPAPHDTHFDAVIRPILQSTCWSCHGPDKDKGGLRLHTPDAIMLGGDTGPAIYPGNAHESELLRRLLLPLDDDDHMPPKNKPQPTPVQIAAIEAWINAGASFDAPASPGTASAPASIPVAVADTAAPSTTPASLPPLDDTALSPFRTSQVHVERLSDDPNALLIDFAAAAGAGHADDALASTLLSPVAEHVRDLSLARSSITDAAAPTLVRLTNLRRLNLAHTHVTSATVSRLASLPRLEELTIIGTVADDEALAGIVEAPSLRVLRVWRSNVTPEGVARLAAARPGLRVDTGADPSAPAVEVEPEVKFTRESATPAPSMPAPVALTPINTSCPVSGAPIDPRYAVVYDGRVIAFCCPNCPKAFWNDPAAYLAKLPK
ncbi:MAG: hypothetical protein HBSAPP03_28210 [Phycisphaerae bacterium]|nr:MAG: hypothetical protein HBSAPP03_28210 [Phycisphaerae bacterium]